MVTATRSRFGTLPDGRAVEAVTLANAAGVSVTVIAWGATLKSVILPDRDGRRADVALGYPDIDGYLGGTGYFGATVGRYANRIAGGRFELDGITYKVPQNNGPNSLHGGTTGFDRQLWEVVAVDAAAVTLRLVSPAGDQGYPGTLTATTRYALDEGGRLEIDYRSTTDAPTIVNITNHAYWNLGGPDSGSARDHVVTIAADRYNPVDATLIPTGELRPVAGTEFDFREPRAVGETPYDHNWILTGTDGALRTVATVADPASGRCFTLASNQPGLQFYSGNPLGLAFEPQRFPDTPNRPAFGSARLDPGQEYCNRIAYAFATR